MPLPYNCHVNPYIALLVVLRWSPSDGYTLSVCQSVCTPLLDLAEHSFDHVHGVVGLRLFNEAAW